MMPVRILHVVGAMNHGGVETWLMYVLRNIDRSQFQFDFLVLSAEPGAYDEEIRALGSRVIACPYPHNPALFVPNLWRTLRKWGPYDVLHSHVHHYSGLVLNVASRLNIPVRIAHSHSDTSGLQTRMALPRQLYLRIMKYWIARYATLGLAASQKAAAALWGKDWQSDPRWKLLYCGVDIAPFAHGCAQAKEYVRQELGIPQRSMVLGHVGGLKPVKNHQFLLRLTQDLLQSGLKVTLLLVGDGPLRNSILRQAAEMNIQEHVILTGARIDVPQLLLGAIDVFVFPSFYEGLPVAIIEAQAAGLPIILSNMITAEVDIVPGLLTWLPIDHQVTAWAQACITAYNWHSGLTQSDAYEVVRQSPFTIERSIKDLRRAYGAG